ncbi:MAG TPA: 23S rRNA (uracil(1939)-C(5))-methyltransferase RlmD, partial [Candidatus Eisenbacteria bacterium]|nr:23S rRNA (uracil(1939)-C(5))-methyltransferase RlmD [Candidatus Eisenbacteria bacterium]
LGIIQNINPERGNVIWGRSFRTLGGHDTIEERIGLLKLHYPAGVFSQANPFTARRVYEAAIELAGLRGEETVVDLYCGVGPVALYAAPGARLVYAIDDHERSVAAAKQNARSNGIGNCRFFAGEIAAELERIRRSAGPIDVCILNPPRKGAHSGALQALLDAAPRRIVYISCDPGSLTRDLEHAVGRGYRLVRLRPFDMFPQTDQVETVAQLNRSDVEV